MNDFDKVATTPLDEWIEFLKTGAISSKATAAGLPEARERLRVDALSKEEKQSYYRHLDAVRHMKSLFDTSRDEGYQEGKQEGKQEEKFETAKRLIEMGFSLEQVARGSGLPLDTVSKLAK